MAGDALTVMDVMRAVDPVLTAYEKTFPKGIRHAELVGLIGYILACAGTDERETAQVLFDAHAFMKTVPGHGA